MGFEPTTTQFTEIYMYVCMYVCMYVSIHRSIDRSIYLSVYLSIYVSKHIKDDCVLASCGVVSLYTSIPHDLGLEALSCWIDKNGT